MVNLSDFRDRLREYLETTLPTICQVEAGPLAKYVMTLLERNQELEELQESCDEKLEEFLHDNTKPFVNDLFKFIRGQMAQQRQSRYGGDEDDADDRHKRRRSREDDSGRKRRADSRERSDRRGSDRYEREDDRRGARGRGREGGRDGPRDRPAQANRQPQQPVQQQQQQPLLQLQPQQQQQRQPRAGAGRRRERCRDFEFRGFCVRGDSCPYDHEGYQVVGADLSAVGGGRDAPYDPERATIDFKRSARDMRQPLPLLPDGVLPMEVLDTTAREPLPMPPPPVPAFPQTDAIELTPARTPRGGGRGGFVPGGGGRFQREGRGGGGAGGDRNRDGNRERDDRFGGGRGGGGGGRREGRDRRQDYMSRVREERRSNLVVLNIPPERNNFKDVSDYFSRFGEILNLRVVLSAGCAFVNFRTHEQAMAAMQSPEPIFNNRLVEVKWAKKDLVQDALEAAVKTGAAPAPGAAPAQPAPQQPPAPPAPAQRAPPGRGSLTLKKPTEDVAALRAKLLAKQIQQQKDLLEQIASNKALTAEDRAELMQKVAQLSSQIETALARQKEITVKVAQPAAAAVAAGAEKPAARTVDLQKAALDRELDQITQVKPAAADAAAPAAESVDQKLLRLEREAAAMGVVDENGNPVPPAGGPVLRGGPRGRGRGRGRVAVAAGWGGRGRGRGGRGGGLSLDNRTSTVRVTLPADQPQLQQEQGIRQLFQAFGPLASVEISGDSALVKLSARKSAESAMNTGVYVGANRLPMAWHEPVAAGGDGGAAAAEGGDAGDGGSDEEDEDREKSWRYAASPCSGHASAQ